MLVFRILVNQLTVCVLEHVRFTCEHCRHLDICGPVLCVKDVVNDQILRLLIQFFHHFLGQLVEAGLLLTEVIYTLIHGLVEVILAVIIVG